MAGQSAGRSVSGLVEDMLGGAVAGAAVRAQCGAITAETRTDASGEFSIAGLPAEACVVEARAELFTPVRVIVDLRTRSHGFARLVADLAGLTSEVTVTPARGEQERTFDVPEAVGVATAEEIASRPVQILPQALREETGVLVQQTTTAQGSPFIRGFSAQRVVYLLDGVRFNTSTARAGATQYLGWIDAGNVQRMEIVRGPTSVQYGSDALGGTINVLTRRPEISPGGLHASGQLELSGATADRRGGLHVFGQVRARRFALRGAAATRASGDLRTGRGVDSHSALTRYLGLPSATLYDRLPGSGYRQAGWTAAGTMPFTNGSALSGVFMEEAQAGVTRYDRTLGGDGLFRSAFDPQRLHFGYARYHRGAVGMFAAVQATVSLNQQRDDRLEQARPSAAVETETSRVRVVGYAAEGTLRPWRGHVVSTGAELYDESIATTRERTLEGHVSPLRPEIPDGATYRSAAVFAQDSASLAGNRLSLRAGVRAATFRYAAPADALMGVTDDRLRAGAFTYNTGLVWGVLPVLNIIGSVSRGFRAANAFDLGAIGVSGGGFEVAPQEAARLGALAGSDDGAMAVSAGRVVSSLRPEHVHAFEGGLKLRTARVAGSGALFDLHLRDLIARRTVIFPQERAGTSIAGYAIVAQDAIGRAYVAADPRPIVTRVNVDRARVRGVEADAQVRLTRAWIASAHVSMAHGRESTGASMRRMPPVLGGLRVKWEPTLLSFWAEGVISAAAGQDHLSAGDLSDARMGATRRRVDIAAFFNGTARDLGLVSDARLVATGETLADVQARVLGTADALPLFTSTPGFVVASVRAGWRLSDRVEATVILDNLTDRSYRWHGSGVDAPGFSIAARLRFRL